MANTYIVGFPSNYKTPSTVGTVYNLLDLDASLVEPGALPVSGSKYSGYILIKNKNGETRYSFDDYGKVEGIIKINDEIVNIPQTTFRIEEGINEIYYYTEIYDYDSISGSINKRGEHNNIFSINGVSNKYPLKPWTNGEVMDRLLQLVEPIRKNQTPRFAWQAPEGKEKAFAELAPEYTFTRLNLRECCQTVGGRIHAEPRLKTINGKDTITFDFYGEQEYATIKNHKTNTTKRLSSYKYTTNKGVFDLEQTCTRLDSYMENLVSRVDWERATIGQPYEGQKGGLTLRTATHYERAVETDGYYFVTQYPIDRPISFYAKTPSGTWVDITGYLYEKQVYNNLSGYQNYAPAKSFALYYEQGQKGINGFFYKVPSSNPNNVAYSIVNIVRAVSGETITDYTQMQFRLTYVPIFSTRVGHGKQYINDYLPLPRVINYSQGANQVESRYFGQNIKATAQRLGNVEKSYTLNIRNADNIPKAGQLWDENYYIATMAVECGVDLLRITVGLSKHFNRKSQYIGANSYRRVYEVSEVMVQERNTVYNDYLIVRKAQSESNAFASDTILLSPTAFSYTTVGLFTNEDNIETNITKYNAEIAGVQFVTKTKNGAPNNYIILPVVSSAFGNAMDFTFECQDNFSAGIRSDVSLVNSNWVYGTGTEYGDYYGRGYYFDFMLLSKGQLDIVWDSVLLDSDISNENDFPLVENPYSVARKTMAGTINETSTAGSYLYRKDSREKTKITYSLEFVADGDDFVLGSALTEGNPLVTYSGIVPHLYVLPFAVNRFADRLSSAELSNAGAFDIGELGQGLFSSLPAQYFCRCNGIAYSGSGLSWCIALPVSTVQDGQVEDEDGNVVPFMREVGGDILIARNVDISTVDRIGDFEILAVHDLFEDYINKK